MRMKSMLALSLVIATSCVAQPATTTPAAPTTLPAAGEVASTAELLELMHKVGVEMKSLRATLTLHNTDVASGDNTLQSGTIVLERSSPSDVRIHVNFTKLVVDDKREYDERIEYLLAGDWVVDRSYGRDANDPAGKRETHRQIRKPGDRTDLLKLGEGPFPLPIGQAAEIVKDEFEVTQLPNDAEKPGLVGLELRPKPTNRLSDKFETITVWVDPKTGMPHVIETLDPNGSQRKETRLGEVKLNEPVTDADFTLEPIDQKVWTVTHVPLE